MDLIEHLLMKLVSFGGISTYSNTVLKKEKSRFIPTRINLKKLNLMNKGASSYSFYIFILTQIFIYVKCF